MFDNRPAAQAWIDYHYKSVMDAVGNVSIITGKAMPAFTPPTTRKNRLHNLQLSIRFLNDNSAIDIAKLGGIASAVPHTIRNSNQLGGWLKDWVEAAEARFREPEALPQRNPHAHVLPPKKQNPPQNSGWNYFFAVLLVIDIVSIVLNTVALYFSIPSLDFILEPIKTFFGLLDTGNWSLPDEALLPAIAVLGQSSLLAMLGLGSKNIIVSLLSKIPPIKWCLEKFDSLSPEKKIVVWMLLAVGFIAAAASCGATGGLAFLVPIMLGLCLNAIIKVIKIVVELLTIPTSAVLPAAQNTFVSNLLHNNIFDETKTIASNLKISPVSAFENIKTIKKYQGRHGELEQAKKQINLLLCAKPFDIERLQRMLAQDATTEQKIATFHALFALAEIAATTESYQQKFINIVAALSESPHAEVIANNMVNACNCALTANILVPVGLEYLARSIQTTAASVETREIWAAFADYAPYETPVMRQQQAVVNSLLAKDVKEISAEDIAALQRILVIDPRSADYEATTAIAHTSLLALAEVAADQFIEDSKVEVILKIFTDTPHAEAIAKNMLNARDSALASPLANCGLKELARFIQMSGQTKQVRRLWARVLPVEERTIALSDSSGIKSRSYAHIPAHPTRAGYPHFNAQPWQMPPESSMSAASLPRSRSAQAGLPNKAFLMCS